MEDEKQRQKLDPRRGGVTEWFGLWTRGPLEQRVLIWNATSVMSLLFHCWNRSVERKRASVRVCVGYGRRLFSVFVRLESKNQKTRGIGEGEQQGFVFNETSPPHTLSITSDNLFFFLVLMFFPYVCRICFFSVFVLSKYSFPSVNPVVSLVFIFLRHTWSSAPGESSIYIYISSWLDPTAWTVTSFPLLGVCLGLISWIW